MGFYPDFARSAESWKPTQGVGWRPRGKPTAGCYLV